MISKPKWHIHAFHSFGNVRVRVRRTIFQKNSKRQCNWGSITSQNAVCMPKLIFIHLTILKKIYRLFCTGHWPNTAHQILIHGNAWTTPPPLITMLPRDNCVMCIYVNIYLSLIGGSQNNCLMALLLPKNSCHSRNL